MENVSADFTINENQPLQAEYTLGESEHFDCTFELFASGTVWGSIDGNIENQTDLWEILSSKADIETVNHDLEVIEGEISDLSYTVDNNYTTLVNRLGNDELAISNNANEITSINNTILTYGDIVTYDASNFATSAQGALANTALQPNDNISELVNNVGYITSASLPTLEDLTTQAQMDALNSGATSTKINQIASNTQAISTETTNRQDADNNLQSQIDAITASSDVTDIVGTYAQLQAYDTSTLPPNSIIKVLQDEHQNYETTYYRWVITGGVGSWVLIGEEGPYYTKSEANSTFVPQTRTVNGKALSTNITLDANDVGALPSSTVIPVVDQTFDGTSANAQSGVAIVGAKFLQNIATGNSSITVNGTATAKSQAINIGTGSQATGNYGTALGAYSFGNASHAVGIGNYAKATADYAIQLNKGTNNTSNSLCVGFNNDNYQLLDGTTGLIPDARISTNIARTSDLSDYVLSDNTGETTYITADTLEISVDTVATINGSNILIAGQNTINNSSFYLDDFEMDYQINGVTVNYFSETFSLISAKDSNTDIGSTLELYTNSFVLSQSPDGNSTYGASITVPANNQIAINGNIIATQTWVTNQGYTSNVGTVTSVNNTQPDANGNVTIPTGGTVDQTYNGNSSNAQSGVAIKNAKFIQNNTSTLSNLTVSIGEFTNNSLQSVSVGYGSSLSNSANYSIAIGYGSYCSNPYGIAIGTWGQSTAEGAIQIGRGTNSTANTLQIGLWDGNASNNYQLLDGTTGLIPDARISTNIARSSDIPTNTSDLTNDSGFITGITSSDVTTALGYTPYNASNPSGYITSSDLPTNHVTTDTTQNITGTKTFVGQKKIAFKQSGTSDKLGFTLYNNSGTEKGYLEYNPSNNVDGVPLMTLGNYATASGGLTHVGFRKYSSISGASGAYNLLTPLISDAKTPFSLTTTYTNFYLPLGFTDGNTTVKTAKSGMVDLSSIIPTATSDLTNDSGFITSIPTATSSTLGMVQPDNTTITIDSNGVISSNVASRNVGEIIQSTIPLTDAGLHLLDGSLLAYGSYQAFIDYIADLYDSGNYDDIFETEADWQSSVTTYGVCGKFVYDSVNQTVRLPKITGFTEGTIDPTVLGDLIEAGLPDATIQIATETVTDASGTAYVSSSSHNRWKASQGAVSTYKDTALFKLSQASTIYGNSNTAQPQAIKVLYYIVIATAKKTSLQIDIDEIATDLNSKADVGLANVNDSGASLGASWAMPSSTSINLTLGSSGTGYIAPSEGYFSFVSGNSGSYPKEVELENLTSNISSSAHNSVNNGWLRCSIPAKKGDQVNIWYQNLDFKSLKFVYAQGSESEAN